MVKLNETDRQQKMGRTDNSKNRPRHLFSSSFMQSSPSIQSAIDSCSQFMARFVYCGNQSYCELSTLIVHSLELRPQLSPHSCGCTGPKVNAILLFLSPILRLLPRIWRKSLATAPTKTKVPCNMLRRSTYCSIRPLVQPADLLVSRRSSIPERPSPVHEKTTPLFVVSSTLHNYG